MLGLDAPAGEPADDLAQEADGDGLDGAGLLPACLGVAHFREEQGQVTLLHLGGALAGQVAVEVLPGRPERLAGDGLFLPQPGRVRAAGSLQELLVKGVPVAGDAGQEHGQGRGGVMRGRAGAADPGGHEDRPGQHGGGLAQPLAAVQGTVLLHGVEEGVERDLADHVAAVTPVAVEVVRVPLAEDVVGPAVDGMAVVVGAQVHGQFLEDGQIELRVGQEARVGGRQDLQGAGGQVVVAAPGHAGAAEEER